MPSFSRNVVAPLVHLCNNWISLAGVVVVTTASVFLLFLLPIALRGEVAHPYIGILIFIALPAFFFLGLFLIPLGMWLQRRRERKAGASQSSFPPLNWANTDFRRVTFFVVATTFVNVVISGQVAFGAVNYMDSTNFCGLTCHTVMEPEFVSHANSPHSRVECAACHIGPGAS